MKLEQLFQPPQAIPSIPQVLQELIVALGDEASQPLTLARLIEHDAAISARLLQLANSAFFSPGREIHTVSQALDQLGTVNVRSVVIGFGLKSRFNTLENAVLQPFWRNSLRMAATAQHWAALPEVQLNVHHAWTVGLLYTIGQLFMHMGLPQDMQALDAQMEPLAPERIALEREKFGFGYPEVSAELVRRWRLPALFHEVLSVEPWRPSPPEITPIAALVQMAVRQVWVYGTDDAKQRCDTPWPVELAAVVPLQPEQAAESFPGWQPLCGKLEAMLD